MLPDQRPDYSPPDAPDSPESPESVPLLSSPAAVSVLALFVLGATIGLLALLGRIAQEFQFSLLADFHAATWPAASESAPLPPMIDGLTTPGQRLVAAGFAAGTLCIAASAALWWRDRPLNTALGRAWTRLGSLIALALLVGMVCALIWPDSPVRLALLISTVIPAGLLFVILVVWIVWASLPGN